MPASVSLTAGASVGAGRFAGTVSTANGGSGLAHSGELRGRTKIDHVGGDEIGGGGQWCGVPAFAPRREPLPLHAVRAVGVLASGAGADGGNRRLLVCGQAAGGCGGKGDLFVVSVCVVLFHNRDYRTRYNILSTPIRAPKIDSSILTRKAG